MIPDLHHTPWRAIVLSEKQGVWCLVDAADYDWLSAWRWNISWGSRSRDTLYAKRNVGVERATIRMHRAIMAHHAPRDDAAGLHVDHINGCSLDNRRDNLRWLTNRENVAAMTRLKRVPTLDEVVARLLADFTPRQQPQFEELPF